jgi:ketosteroid isomerase-like protein
MILAIGSPLAGQAATKGSEEAIRDVLKQSTSSIEANDIASATKVWSNDESLTVFESGRANYGWADYRDRHLIPELRVLRNTQYVLSDIKVHMAGRTAWATFNYSIAADVGEAEKTRRVGHAGLGTAVLELRDGRWRIVHWHSSSPRRQPAPTALHKP